jgi:hypothetical protein
MCFNGPKTYQLGWYSQYHLNLPSSGSYNWNGNLVGIAEKASASASDKIIVRIMTSTTDTYVHFNRAIGMNVGTLEGGDQVLVTTQNTGTGHADSNLVSKMSTGSIYTIPNFNGSPNPLVIRVVSISTNTVPGRANISVQFGAPVPTLKPTPKPTGTGTGTCGGGSRGNGVCRNSSLCCSKWGYCGTGNDYCGTTPLGDWSLCSTSNQCQNGCCSGQYSNGVAKCTPLNGGYRPDICIAPGPSARYLRTSGTDKKDALN